MNKRAYRRSEFSVFSRFAQERLVFHPNLSCPVKLLFQEFERWAGEDVLGAEVFVDCLKDSGVTIQAAGKGRLKCVAHGTGVRPLPVRHRS
jgi:hypothetical protein